MRTLSTAIAVLLASLPAAAQTPAAYAQTSLRDACAQSYASYSANYPPGSTAPAFSGERYQGDNRYYNNAKPCNEAQYAVYLEKADPGTVAMAYPSAAGKKAKASGAAASAPKK